MIQSVQDRLEFQQKLEDVPVHTQMFLSYDHVYGPLDFVMQINHLASFLNVRAIPPIAFHLHRAHLRKIRIQVHEDVLYIGRKPTIVAPIRIGFQLRENLSVEREDQIVFEQIQVLQQFEVLV